MSSVKPEDSGLDASTHVAHVQMLIGEVTRGDPGAAHARYSVAMSLLSYAEKLDNHPGDAPFAPRSGSSRALVEATCTDNELRARGSREVNSKPRRRSGSQVRRHVREAADLGAQTS